MPETKDDFVFFWKTNEVHGWGSQWASSPFTLPLNLDPSNPSSTAHPTTFLSAEHYMMVHKALLFNNPSIAHQILSISTINSRSMAKIKALGREVEGFDEAVWVANRERIVLEGNLGKFRQNEGMRGKLMGTGERGIVEASPRDAVWGIGFDEKSAMERRGEWGLNLLGKALEETRRILREEEGGEEKIEGEGALTFK